MADQGTLRSTSSKIGKRNKKQTQNKDKDKVKITNDQLNFLRKAEQENDVDVGVEEFGVGLIERRGQRKKKSKTRSVKSRSRKKQGAANKWPASAYPSRHEVKASGTSAALFDVAEDLEELGTNSTSEQSEATTISIRKRSDPDKGFSSRLKRLLGYDRRVHPSEGKKESDDHKVSTEHARRIRFKLARRRKRVEHCTYQLLLMIIVLRLITTLVIVYEYEEFSITLEYLLRLRKVNCLQVYDFVLIDVWPLILLLYFTACCILPTLTSREVCKACIVWMLIQCLYTGHRFFIAQQVFFFREFHLSTLTTALFIGHSLLDVLSFTIVMIRYYYWANPCLERDRYSNTMLGDYLVNEYIQFMVQSSFIRKKTAVQRATAFQVMTVVRKLKDKYRSSGDGPTDSAIQKEVNSAIHALKDWKKFPALRIIHSFEVKEKIMKEKLKLRRQRIREMKDRFNKLLEKQRKKGLVSNKMKNRSSKDAVFLNKQGQAFGIKGNEKSRIAQVMQELNAKKEESYQNKRTALMNHIKK